VTHKVIARKQALSMEELLERAPVEKRLDYWKRLLD
jgi:hypothetical protein